jgi:hypothetical protein
VLEEIDEDMSDDDTPDEDTPDEAASLAARPLSCLLTSRPVVTEDSASVAAAGWLAGGYLLTTARWPEDGETDPGLRRDP